MKILMVSTISNTINTFLVPHIQMLVNQGVQVDVAFNEEQKVDIRLKELGCNIYIIKFNRSIFKNNFPSLIRDLRKIVIDGKYDVVHTHTPIASTIVRIACKNIQNTDVYYTAHGFHFYKGSPALNWIIYYPIERFLSRFTDKLITINAEDFHVSQKFNAKKNYLVRGVGIDLEKIGSANNNQLLLKNELNIPDESIILLSIGELNKNKNHKIVIEAISKLDKSDIHYVICGVGKELENLKSLAKKLGLERQVHFLGFRKDISEILNYTDVFVFPSFREGLSVSVMEAMASGLPIIASDIRGNRDLVINGQGGELFNPNDSEELSYKISKFYTDKFLRKKYGKFNLDRIKLFSLDEVLKDMKEIYFSDHVTK